MAICIYENLAAFCNRIDATTAEQVKTSSVGGWFLAPFFTVGNLFWVVARFGKVSLPRKHILKIQFHGFRFEISKSVLTGAVSAALGIGGATILGKTLVSGVLKLIPGVGTLAGGAISGAAASAITSALGEAYIQVMDLVFADELQIEDLGTSLGRNKLKDNFKEELKKKSKK